jgi:predicted transposase YbfD/YdcC
MTAQQNNSIVEYFAEVVDPRVERTKDHPLVNILVITLCAVICGADDWVSVEEYGCSKAEWLGRFLDLSHGIPSHDTFGRVFGLLEPEQMERCFLKWVQAVAQLTEGEVVAIDGKQLNGSGQEPLQKKRKEAKGQYAIRMVSAWACANRLVLGQRKVDAKSNEIKAIPALLEMLDLHGCIVTIDAIGTHRKIAEQIQRQGADYVLPLKDNQKLLHTAVAEFFQYAQQVKYRQIAHDTALDIDAGHGRIEKRECWITDDIGWLPEATGKPLWPGLRSIAMLRCERRIGKQVTVFTRFYLTSLPPDAKRFTAVVRAHWCIENQLHWVLDVAFDEDNNRARSGHSPHNLAIIRHLALNLIKQDTSTKIGVKNRRLKAGWDDDYLARLIWG